MLWILLLAGLSGLVDTPAGSEAPAKKKKAATADLERWIGELDSKRFSQRQNASKYLFRAGQRALPALTRAAETSPSREVVTRCIEILHRHRKEGDDATKKLANASLDKISKSGNKIAATRAHGILHPKPLVPANPFGGRKVRGPIVFQRGAGGFRGRVVRGRIQIVQLNPRGANRSTTIDNGKQRISIQQDRTGIRISVTTRDGKKSTVKKYTAKTADELKKKHPEAYKIFKKHLPGPLIGRPIPRRIQKPAGNPFGRAILPPDVKRLEDATRRLKQITLPVVIPR